VIFRSVIIPLHLMAKVSPTRIVFLTPLYFGIAHVHHFYEFTLTNPHTDIRSSLARSLFQFSYTTIFGWFAAFVYLRTGSLLAVIIIHAFCNYCGLPRLWGRVEGPLFIDPSQITRNGVPDTGGAQADTTKLGIGWTVAYYVLLFAGAITFYWQLWPLTHSAQELVSFNSK
jgi:prenyl protein peptidase